MKLKLLVVSTDYIYLCSNMTKTIIAILLLTLLGGCKNRDIKQNIDAIDSLMMSEYEDSAYSILLKINPSDINDEADRAHYYLLLAKGAYMLGNQLPPDSILDWAIAYYKKSDDYVKLSDCYYYKSTQEVMKGDYSQAVLYAKKAEQHASSLNQKYKTTERLCFLNGLCGNYMLQLDYAKKAYDIAYTTKNKNWLAYSLSGIGAAYSNLDIFDSAHYYFNLTKPYIKYVDEDKRASFITNIGMVYKDKDVNKAIQLFKESLDLKETSAALENLADIYYSKGKQEEAYEIWKKALTINDGDYKDNIIHSILSYDIEHGRIEEACDNLDEIIYLKDSMLNKLKNDTIKDMQLNFDHEISMLHQEKIASNWKIGTLLVISLLLQLTIYAIWKHSRMKNKIHDEQMQINDYVNQIHELKTFNGDASEAIFELNSKIKEGLEEMSPQLLRGQILYEQIKNGKIDTIYNWSTKDEKLFIEFYKAIDYRTVHELTSVKRTDKLTTHRLFYLLLKAMGKTDKKYNTSLVYQIME